MSKNEKSITIRESLQEWFTVREAVMVAKRKANVHIIESDIYRYALNIRIYLSIYFQSLIVLRRAKKLSKIKIKANCKFTHETTLHA